jgi:DNA-binding response OmpR family regulator
MHSDRSVGSDAVRVLVVDDEPAIRALVTKIIQRAGLDAEGARDGAEAIAMMDAADYAVVVVDLMMPNVDGHGVIANIKARPKPHPAIIVISAADPNALRRLDGSMVHSIVRKPFDIDVLADLVLAAARVASEQRNGVVVKFPGTASSQS